MELNTYRLNSLESKAGSRRAGTPRRKQSIFGACPSAGFAGSVCRAQNRARGAPGQKKLQDVLFIR